MNQLYSALRILCKLGQSKLPIEHFFNVLNIEASVLTKLIDGNKLMALFIVFLFDLFQKVKTRSFAFASYTLNFFGMNT